MKKVNAVLKGLSIGRYWDSTVTPYTMTIELDLDEGFKQYLADAGSDKEKQRIVDALNNAEINIHILDL